jgi:cysteine desulfurase
MTAARAYLDWNASAPLLPEARSAMVAAFECVGNPSSVHAEGRRARGIVETARAQIARLVGARPEQVILTSGATEANATVLAGEWHALFVSAMEHDSILAGASASPARSSALDAGADGVVKLASVGRAAEAVANRTDRQLVCLQLANNETGVIQPVAEAVALARQARMHVLCDATQAVGRLEVDFAALGVDYMTFSSHKIGGPKGAGALVVRDDAPLNPLIGGGGQERRQRAGTENVAAIAGFGAAAEAACQRLADWRALASRRDALEARLREVAPDAVILGAASSRLPNTSLVAWPGRRAETLLAMLDLGGVAVSSGAACASGKVTESHVLRAMGCAPDVAGSAIRISIGPETSDREIEMLVAAFEAINRRPARAA